MITAKEAREIAKENENFIKDIVEEELVMFDEIIRDEAEIGKTSLVWVADNLEDGIFLSPYIYDIKEALSKYGYSVSIDFDDESGHYLTVSW